MQVRSIHGFSFIPGKLNQSQRNQYLNACQILSGPRTSPCISGWNWFYSIQCIVNISGPQEDELLPWYKLSGILIHINDNLNYHIHCIKRHSEVQQQPNAASFFLNAVYLSVWLHLELLSPDNSLYQCKNLYELWTNSLEDLWIIGIWTKALRHYHKQDRFSFYHSVFYTGRAVLDMN